VLLGLALTAGASAQSASPWRFWDSADGFVESYTSSAARDADGSVWVKHGAVGALDLLNGYGLRKMPEPGGSGKIERSSDGAMWIWADGRIKRYLDSRWTSWRVDEVSKLGTLRGNALENYDIAYYSSRAMQGTIHVVALDLGHALIQLPDRVLEFDAAAGAAHTALSLEQTPLGRFVSLSGMGTGGDDTLILTGLGGLGRIRRNPGGAWQWLGMTQPPRGFEEFDYPFRDGRELYLTGITSSAATAALRFDGKNWSELYRGESRNLRAWPGSDGAVWIQDGNHLFEIAGRRRTLVPRNDALSGIIIAVIPETRGRFWVASSQGLAHYMPSLWRTPVGAPELDDVVSSITEDSKGRVWFLAAHALICLNGDVWSTYPFPHGETSWAVFTEGLGVLPDGRVVIRTTSSHVLLFDPLTSVFSAVQHPGKNSMRLMIAQPGGRILFEVYPADTQKSIVEAFDGRNFTPLMGEAELGWHTDNRSFAFGPDGEMWLGSTTAFGVWRHGAFHAIGAAQGFFDQGAYYVYRDPDGRMYAGGRDAFYREEDGRWLKLRSGLDRVRNALRSRDGTLWIASGTGVHRYRDGKWIQNGAEEGLPSSVAYKVYEDSRGRIWAGTTRGISLFHAEADSEAPVAVLAEDQNPKEAPPGGKVRLEFSGIDKWKFTLPGRLLFSWRIDGGVWSDFASAASASFSGLSAGRHRFEVRAMDRNGNISAVPAVHNFAVMVPWYATPEFRLLAAGAGILIVFLLSLATVNYLHRGRLIVELNRKNRLERDRQRILQMIAGRKPTRSILQQIAISVAGHSEDAICAVTLDQREGFTAVWHPAPRPGLHRKVEDLTARRPGTIAEWRAGLDQIVAEDLTAGYEIVGYGSEGAQACGVILLLLPAVARKADGVRWLLETFAGLAAGAVENARLYVELGHQARHDVLTGLPNRLCFEEHLESVAGRGAPGRALALLYVDLDRFKQINDTLGHRVGDLFLKQVAARFTGALGAGRTLFRIGGDEFIVIAEQGADRDRVESLAWEMLASLQLPIHIEGRDLFASASIGVSFYPADGKTPSAVQKHADIAMYRAKSRGPNCVEFYSVEMASGTEAALETEQILRRTLEKGSFELFYQPQFTGSGEISGFEALLRLPLPERHAIGPDTFVPIAESTGLIVPMGRWVLREACSQAREWLDEGLHLTRMSVNISAVEIARPAFADEVERMLTSIPLDPSVLEIEITESAIIGNIAESTRQMRKLRALGVRMAIDDFGTGYSSLSYLQTLPIDALKIDRSFVDAIRNAHDKPPLVQAIVALGRNMGLQLIAEGIETPAQLSALSGTDGCDYLQGYLLGRPAPASEARELLRSASPERAQGFLPSISAIGAKTSPESALESV